MPRDNDKYSGPSRGRRDGPSPGKGRSGAARGPEKKFAKRGFASKNEGASGAEKRDQNRAPVLPDGRLRLSLDIPSLCLGIAL